MNTNENVTAKLTTKEIFAAHEASNGPRPEKGSEGYIAWMRGYWKKNRDHAKAGTRVVASKAGQVKLHGRPFSRSRADYMFATLGNDCISLASLTDAMVAHGYRIAGGEMLAPLVVVRMTPEEREAKRVADKKAKLLAELSKLGVTLPVEPAAVVPEALAVVEAPAASETVTKKVRSKKAS
jgi:hypothetical protein